MLMEAAVEQVVNAVCALGCARVRECITALRDAQTLPEYASLNRAQRDRLLRELRSIMKVYDARC